MIKPIKYFFEAFFVYLFFLIAKLIGLSLSRKFFSKTNIIYLLRFELGLCGKDNLNTWMSSIKKFLKIDINNI